MKKYIWLLYICLMAHVMTLQAKDNTATAAASSPRSARINGVEKVTFPGGRCMMYRLYLQDKDKANNPYRLEKPEEFLSLRSIERRKKQNLALDSTDLPIAPRYEQAIRNKGIEIVGESKWNNTLLIRIHKEKELKLLSDLTFISHKKKVFASPDSINERKRSAFRNDFVNGDGASDEYGNTFGQTEALNGRTLHDKGFRGEGKMIAVFDGGFMNVDKIPALHKIKLAGKKDFVVPHSTNIFEEMEHGTMVLSTMAANVPRYFVGTATEAEYLLVRCEDEHTETLAEEDYWASAAEYADSMGVDIINSSLGYHDFDDASMNFRYAMQDGKSTLISRTASMLADKGIVCVNSAGNDGMGSWKRINFPADANEILTVGSITEKGVNAPFSAVGPTADGRIKPDVMAWGSPTSVITGRGNIINDNGTSFSAPLIAGMVACLWQALPNKTAHQIIKLVRLAGNNQQHPDNVYGYGVPDFWKAYQTGKAL